MFLACSHTSGSTVGGRLSTTYQPRSSSVFAAVERPAPDIPVTTTSRNGLGGRAVDARRGTGSGLAAHRPILSGTHQLLITSPVAMLTASLCGADARASLIARASLGPKPGTAAISSTVAARSFFSEPK